MFVVIFHVRSLLLMLIAKACVIVCTMFCFFCYACLFRLVVFCWCFYGFVFCSVFSDPCLGSTSPPSGNQVDGLPPASSLRSLRNIDQTCFPEVCFLKSSFLEKLIISDS